MKLLQSISEAKHISYPLLRRGLGRCLLILSSAVTLFACEKEVDRSDELTGLWEQQQIYIDDQAQNMSDGELATSLFLEGNGIYRLYDGVNKKEHAGTWLFSDGEWLNLSLDKIQRKNADGSLVIGQVLVRFTIFNLNDDTLELRIRTYLYERKASIMFNLMAQDDTTGMTNEEKIELDKMNKELHTYRYVFKKADLQ